MLYKAVVKDITDPEGRERVRVECEELYDDYLSPWCEICIFTRDVPYTSIELGDKVWIALEQGKYNYPIMVGYQYPAT